MVQVDMYFMPSSATEVQIQVVAKLTGKHVLLVSVAENEIQVLDLLVLGPQLLVCAL